MAHQHVEQQTHAPQEGLLAVRRPIPPSRKTPQVRGSAHRIAHHGGAVMTLRIWWWRAHCGTLATRIHGPGALRRDDAPLCARHGPRSGNHGSRRPCTELPFPTMLPGSMINGTPPGNRACGVLRRADSRAGRGRVVSNTDVWWLGSGLPLPATGAWRQPELIRRGRDADARVRPSARRAVWRVSPMAATAPQGEKAVGPPRGEPTTGRGDPIPGFAPPS